MALKELSQKDSPSRFKQLGAAVVTSIKKVLSPKSKNGVERFEVNDTLSDTHSIDTRYNSFDEFLEVDFETKEQTTPQSNSNPFAKSSRVHRTPGEESVSEFETVRKKFKKPIVSNYNLRSKPDAVLGRWRRIITPRRKKEKTVDGPVSSKLKEVTTTVLPNQYKEATQTSVKTQPSAPTLAQIEKSTGSKADQVVGRQTGARPKESKMAMAMGAGTGDNVIYSCPFYEQLPPGDRPKQIFDGLRTGGMDEREAFEVTMGVIQREKEKRQLPRTTGKGSLNDVMEDRRLTEETVTLQQQQQAISLLQGLHSFSGSSSVDGLKPLRFDHWIRQFESIISIARWQEDRKIKLLASKLTDLAADSLEDFLQGTPRATYDLVKRHLMNRFHSEVRSSYVKEYKDCRRLPGETVIDYACRLKKLFHLAYPMGDTMRNNTDAVNITERILKDKFIDGLPFEIRYKIKQKEFPTFDELVKFSNKMAVCFDEERKEKEHREIISNIHGISLGRENSALDEVRDLKKQIQAIHDAMIQQVAASQPRGLPPPWQGTPTNGQGRQRQFVPFQNSQSLQRQGSFRPGNYRQNNVKQIICEFCQIPNHTKATCRRFFAVHRLCFNCGKEGHMARDCPDDMSNRSNNQMEAQRDQGNK